MKLSIILTVFNKRQYLGRAFESLLEQKEVHEGDYEILAVNDGSTDGSDIVLEDYAKKDARVRILHQENQGLSMARNNGLEKAKGDYIWFVDADDQFSHSSVCLIKKAIETQPDVIPIYAKFEGDDWVHNRISPEVKSGKEVLLDNWEHCGVFWVMRKDFLINNNLLFFPGIYHEDAEFTPRMLYAAKSVCVVPEILYTVLCDPNSITQIPRPKRAYDCLTVAEHLMDFMDKNNESGTSIGKVFNYNISVLINNGLDVIVKNTPKDRRKFNLLFASNSRLLKSLEKAPLIKYRIEAFLFKLFPGHYVGIYKMMKLLG